MSGKQLLKTGATAAGYAYGGPMGAAAANGLTGLAQGDSLQNAALGAGLSYAGGSLFGGAGDQVQALGEEAMKEQAMAKAFEMPVSAAQQKAWESSIGNMMPSSGTSPMQSMFDNPKQVGSNVAARFGQMNPTLGANPMQGLQTANSLMGGNKQQQPQMVPMGGGMAMPMQNQGPTASFASMGPQSTPMLLQPSSMKKKFQSQGLL